LRYFLKYISVNKTFDIQNLNGIVVQSSENYDPFCPPAVSKTELKFEGYEVQKGFDGQTTHEETVRIPVLDNSQDMNFFKNELNYIRESLLNHCFVIRKHGTYAWGKNLFEAKRHLETLDYLCECEWNLIKK
jgi:methylthioribulose-1-phosphate dehydratase